MQSDFSRVEAISLISERIQGPGITTIQYVGDKLNVAYLPISKIRDKQILAHLQQSVTQKDREKYIYALFVINENPMTVRIRKKMKLVSIDDNNTKENRIEVIDLRAN